MNVLHYIPYLDPDVNSPQHSFIDELLRADVHGVVNTLMTRNSYVHTFLPYELADRLIGIKSMLWFALFGRKNFFKALKETNAEIVYIHSVCDYTSLLVAKWATFSRVPVVVATYKSLMPWHTGKLGFVSSIIRRIIARRIMKRDSSFVQVLSSQEKSILQKVFSSSAFCIPNFEAHVALISPIIKNDLGEEDFERFNLSFAKLYRKIIDSNPFWLMNRADRTVENDLLAVGCTLLAGRNPEKEFLPIARIREGLAKVTEEHWRRILLHSFDQDIFNYISVACEALSGETGNIDIAAVDRIPKLMKHVPVEKTVPRIRKARMHQVTEDYERHEKEKELCIMLLNIYYLYRKKLLTRRHISELYVAFRYEEYDEYVLELMLSDLGIHRFAARMLSILSLTMCLGTGYHPLPALEDRKTKKIRRKLFKSNIE